MTTATTELCTFHRDGQWCGLVAADETNHVWPDERMRPGAHVWRHDAKDAARMVKDLTQEAVPLGATAEKTAYRRGYAAGHRGARMAAKRRAQPPCDHQGIGYPWCPTCGPRTRAYAAARINEAIG